MDTLSYILAEIIFKPIMYCYDLIDGFNESFPVYSIILGFFFVFCVYRFIIVRFMGGSSLTPAGVVSDSVVSAASSDRAGRKQKEYDQRVHEQWASHTYSGKKRVVRDHGRKVVIRE